MYIAAIIIVGYTFLGGFSAVCWTDFFQGMLMLGAMLIAPIFAMAVIDFSSSNVTSIPADFWNPVANWKDIISGLAWGLGYFGLPHIIIRFMSISSQKELKKSSAIGIAWTILILVFATLIGIFGRMLLGYDAVVEENSLVFINMVRILFPPILCGLLLAAVLAAAMSTADSQLLSAASAFASDVYKPIVRKNKSGDKEMSWVGRLVIVAIAIAALTIASMPNSGSIMSLVSNAWGVFGAAFGPVIILSLYWKRFNFAGAAAGIVAGAVVDIIWFTQLSSTGIYELFPGFVAGLIVSVIVTLVTKKPSAEVEKLFDAAVNYTDPE